MSKPIVVDVGELGWSLYLVAHLRFLKSYYNFTMAVMTYPDRQCLYEGIADDILNIPDEFYEKFDTSKQECFGIAASTDNESAKRLKSFFLQKIPNGYYIPPGFEFNCKAFGYVYKHKPFQYTQGYGDNAIKEILVFPRSREYRNPIIPTRNLPEEFYVELIKKLSWGFTEFNIRSMGLTSGSYNIEYSLNHGIELVNYINDIKLKSGLQDLINRCQIAVAAVGSQSAPPKITLLQDVPTFMIGHERERHTKTENWMRTKVGFYEVQDYENFDFDECINQIIEFIRSLE